MKRVLVMTPEAMVPPEGEVTAAQRKGARWRTDYDVAAALRALGHEVRFIGLADDLGDLRAAIREFDPHVVFNLLEEFGGELRNVPYVIGYLELIGRAYTGCNPAGMLFATDKALQRKILRYHRIGVPDFAICRVGRPVRIPPRLSFPCIVKSLTHHGSMGISQASVVYDESSLADRVAFVHKQIGTDAIVERYIRGRELYVSIIGNDRLEVFPIWDLRVEGWSDDKPLVATEKIKWDARYQKKVGVTIGPADLDDALQQRIVRVCKRAYRALEQSGYARIDLRLDDDDKAWIIESNPNPQLSRDEEFAESALGAGVDYEHLIHRILNLGFRAMKRSRR
jgi:D-alanine-D-alanine ligase